jgi:hypothetical protein
MSKSNKQVRLYVVKQYLPSGATAIIIGIISHGTVHDSSYFPYLIRNLNDSAFLFCYRRYDSEVNRGCAYKQYLIPINKERKSCGSSLPASMASLFHLPGDFIPSLSN